MATTLPPGDHALGGEGGKLLGICESGVCTRSAPNAPVNSCLFVGRALESSPSGLVKTARRGSNVGNLSEPIPFEMGLQVPCCVRTQAPAESHLRPNASTIGRDFSCVGAAKRVPDYRGPLDARPCAYVHRDSSEASGRL